MYSHHAGLQQKAPLLPKTHARHLQMECNEMWNFHRAPWCFLPPISICSQKACESAAVSVRVYSCESERGGKAYICVPVCVCMSTDASCLNIRIQAGCIFCSSLHLMDKPTVDWAEPVRAVLFCSVLCYTQLGRAWQRRCCRNWSNYPVLCHPADELITASACFPLNLESQ